MTPAPHTLSHLLVTPAPRSISRTKRGCRGPALATAESKPNVPRDRPYMSAQARSERRPSSLRAAHGLTSGRAARITQGDAPTSPTPARTADRECSHSLRVMRRRLRERSRAPAGAADLLRLSPSHAGTARLAGGIVEGELRTGPWRSRAAREGAESRAICSSCHGARACVWAHWSIGPLVLVCRGGASRWQSTNLARSLWARARIPRPSPIHPSSGRLSRQRSSRTGPLLSHAERAALAWRFAAKRWSIGRTAGRPSVTQASGSHRGRLCRPGAPLEGPHAEFQRIVRVAQSPTRPDARRFVRACSKELFEIIQLGHDT